MKIIDKKSITTLIMLALCLNFRLKGQQIDSVWPVNGTKTTSEFIMALDFNYSNEQNYIFDDIDVKISINVYKINDAFGLLNVTDEDILESLVTLNENFAETGIQFKINYIDTVRDYNFGYMPSLNPDPELFIGHSKNNMINLYLVNGLDETSFGFTYYPTDSTKNYVFLLQNLMEGNYLTGLMGSFFGLLPTHETMGGIENIDGSNCSEAGDFICDTYADPNLRLLVDTGKCEYFGTIRDSNGKYYVPTVVNFMSNSWDDCKCLFSPQQIRRIKYYYLKRRTYLR